MAEPPDRPSSNIPSEGDATAAPHSTTSTAELHRLNQELRRLNAELYRGERGFRTLADNVPALFSYIDAEQRYRYVNRRYRKLWKRSAEEIIGTSVAELLGPEGYARARPHIDKVLAGEQVTYQSSFAFADGAHAMQVSYVPDRDEQGKVRGFFALIDDITPLKRAEEALRERESRLSVIMDTAPNAIITIDREGIIRSFNRAAEATFGYSAAEAIGNNVNLLMPPPYCEEHDGYIERYQRTGEPHMIGTRREVRGRRRDGTAFPLEVTVTEVAELDLFVGIARDLTAQRRLEQEVTEASTYEQERIGQEIHDGLGQKLTALSLLAVSLKRELTRYGVPESPILDELIRHLQDATGEARALSRGLAPVPLTEDGLAEALRKFAREMQAATGVICRFEAKPPYPVELEPRSTAVQLYRIAQEAVHNAFRHARPRRITISLGVTGHCPELRVEDDGAGFTPTTDESDGFGLRIMRYRAGLIGGELSIQSEPGKGTRVRCKLTPEESG
jgi:two-component system sensor kinase FixL